MTWFVLNVESAYPIEGETYSMCPLLLVHMYFSLTAAALFYWYANWGHIFHVQRAFTGKVTFLAQRGTAKCSVRPDRWSRPPLKPSVCVLTNHSLASIAHMQTRRRAGPIGEHHVLLILNERVAQRETRAQTDAPSPYTSAFKRACVF